MNLSKIFVTTLLVAPAFCVGAGNWPQWRGPLFNGSSDEKNLPSEWTKESAAWKVEMPGPSAATPIIWGDLVFAPTPDMTARSLHAMCFDRKTGKQLWNKEVSSGVINKDERSNYSSPSPVADAERVYFFFGNGLLVGFDHAGKELWRRDIIKEYGDFSFNWTFSTSPLLYEGKLYLQVLQRDVPVKGHGRSDGLNESYLLALEPATGKTLWRHVRPTDASQESFEAYSTPTPFEDKGQKALLILGGNYVTAHEPGTGKEIWRSISLNPKRTTFWRQVSSAVAGKGVVLACQPQFGSAATAIKPEGTGSLPASAVVWNSDSHKEVSSDVPTPLFYDGDFFVLSDGKKCLSRVEPGSGNIKWTLELPGTRKFEASPTGADGKIYLMNFGGDVLVVDPAKGAISKTIAMGETGDDQMRSAVAVAAGQIFIRTNHRLYCIGK
jgi:outer membrane protein assembly factor BamB